ncbi:imelysin family protein [Chitinimonas lacunae]|uniref:Imelysin family protein n=1 Tax=Chitinimonas lacunae TaxID=1963018 RepID=A0ABV8MMZ5_9NEIS
MRRFPLLALLAWLAVPAFAAEPATIQAAPLITYWQRDVLLPRHEQLATASKTLASSLDALCERPNAARLDSARVAWKSTFLAWRAIEALPLGPTTARRTAWKIDLWPTRMQKIEEAVKLSRPDLPIAEGIGAVAQGLPAIEYLLWGDDRAKAQLGRLQFKQRCRYLSALGTEVAEETQALANAWRSHAASPPDETQAKETLDLAVNMLAVSLEGLRDKKLARMGNPKVKRPVRQDFDAWRSKNTRDGLKATLDAVEGLLFHPMPSSQSFADQLAKAGKPMLVQHLKEEFAAAHTELAKLPGDLALYIADDPSHGKALHESLGRLQKLVELQVADALGITIGFKDGDGD